MRGDTKIFRLVLLGALYFAQGVPWGFITVTIANHLTTLGMNATDIAELVSVGYIPWMFKPALGPVVDLANFGRFGRRRPIIIMAEFLMAASVLLMTRVDPRASFQIFLVLVFIHNACGAMQDVATDGLAIQILRPEERGTGNGVMTAGKYLGSMMGGAALTWFIADGDWRIGAYAAAVMVLVPFVPLLRFVEAPHGLQAGTTGLPLRPRLRAFVQDALRAFGPRIALVAIPFALVFSASESFLYPFMIPLLRNDLHFTQQQVGQLFMVAGVTSAVFGLLGGFLSDRLGRRGALLLGVLGLVFTYLLTAALREHWAVFSFQVATTIITSAFGGLLYSASLALFMDLTTPAVAATQFQVYMSLLNARMWWSTRAGGYAAGHLSAPVMFVVGAAMDLVALAFLRVFSSGRIAAAFQRPATPTPGGASNISTI